jgi:hypothetical protein
MFPNTLVSASMSLSPAVNFITVVFLSCGSGSKTSTLFKGDLLPKFNIFAREFLIEFNSSTLSSASHVLIYALGLTYRIWVQRTSVLNDLIQGMSVSSIFAHTGHAFKILFD